MLTAEKSSKTRQFREWLVTSFDKNETDIKRILVTLGIKSYAYILHDKDTYTQEDIERLEGKDGKGKAIKAGDKKDSHFHIYFHTTGKYTPSKMCSIWEEPSQRVDRVKLPNKALRYLVHTSEFAPKYPYPLECVKTNIKGFDKIVKATLDCVDERESDYLEILHIIREAGCVSYSALLDYISVFKPSLIKTAVDKAYSFKIYISETQIDHSKEDLLDQVFKLKAKCSFLLNRLNEYENVDSAELSSKCDLQSAI